MTLVFFFFFFSCQYLCDKSSYVLCVSAYSRRILILTQFKQGPGSRQDGCDVCQLGYELHTIVGAGVESASGSLMTDLAEEEGEDDEDGGLGKEVGDDEHRGESNQGGSWFLFFWQWVE